MEIQIDCTPLELCDDVEAKVTKFNSEGENLIEDIKSISFDESIQFFKLEKVLTSDNSEVLRITIEKKLKFGPSEFVVSDEIDKQALERLLGIKEGAFFDLDIVENSVEKIKKYLFDRGYRNIKINIDYSRIGGTLVPIFNIDTPDKIVLRNINFPSDIDMIEQSYVLNLSRLKKKVFNRIEFEVLLQRIKTELKSQGYFDFKIDYDSVVDGNFIDVNIKLITGIQRVFDFYGTKVMDRDQLYKLMINKFSQDGLSVNSDTLVESIINEYVKKGFYNTKVKFRIKDFLQPDGQKRRNYYFTIEEGKKVKISKLIFSGNLIFPVEKIENIFFKNSSDLIQAGFLDSDYLNKFSETLKETYLKSGMIFATVSEPRIIFLKDGKQDIVEVTYNIKERQQSIISKIEINNISEPLRQKVLSNIENKENSPLNVIVLEKDISKALDIVREDGFFFARITNISDNNIITYSNNYTNSVIKLDFETGKKTALDNLIISGNRETKSVVIEREVKIKKGEYVTPTNIKNIRDALNSLGLFADIKIIPYVNNRFSDDAVTKINLLIQVKEKEFGAGEFAPGYRTDLGYKASLAITKNNIAGMNHSLSLRTQVNMRSSLSSLDERREREDKSLLEGLLRVGYSIPYVFNWFDFDASVTFQRKRFSSFDADIYEVSPQVSKKFSESFSMSLKYQLERIRQFDATEEKDQATFTIGGLTPSALLDFRDNKIDPRSGFATSLSWEFANPYFGSQKEEDIEINFSKIVSRNKFYIPFFDKSFVMAFSLSMGMQENYADQIKYDSNGNVITNDDGSVRTRGYIPSIKVFRLDGFDTVRGFADSEINRLSNGIDISEIRVQSKAYFTNFKFEPRFYLNDNVALGLFLDAGRLYNESFKPGSLRTSAGTSFKFLTPVGTLDFDYGVKLKRKYLNNGGREGFGRFHLSIGFF
ncbi:MAG: BamA/TamA family outer membrane protein [Oligoflexia bacterium]|nr:BamA/TamA family outer membrane protein [Oligoflexia bacterium]